MQYINLPSTPLSPKLLRLRLAVAVRRYGAEDAIHVLGDGKKFCPACFVRIAETPLWLVHSRPIWCEYCYRILVNSPTQRLSLLASFPEEVLT